MTDSRIMRLDDFDIIAVVKLNGGQYAASDTCIITYGTYGIYIMDGIHGHFIPMSNVDYVNYKAKPPKPDEVPLFDANDFVSIKEPDEGAIFGLG